jgi:hypothetical protein
MEVDTMSVLRQLIEELSRIEESGALKLQESALKLDPWQDYTGADAEELVVTFSPVPGLLRLQQLGDEQQIGELYPQGTEARAMVRPGSYLLGLHGRTSMPRENFTFAITAPKKAQFTATGARSDSAGRVHLPYGPFKV